MQSMEICQMSQHTATKLGFGLEQVPNSETIHTNISDSAYAMTINARDGNQCSTAIMLAETDMRNESTQKSMMGFMLRLMPERRGHSNPNLEMLNVNGNPTTQEL